MWRRFNFLSRKASDVPVDMIELLATMQVEELPLCTAVQDKQVCSRE